MPARRGAGYWFCVRSGFRPGAGRFELGSSSAAAEMGGPSEGAPEAGAVRTAADSTKRGVAVNLGAPCHARESFPTPDAATAGLAACA